MTVVAVGKPDGRDDLAGRVFEKGVRLDVLQHHLPNSPGPVLQALVLPHPIELRDDLVGDAETRSYSRHETASLREPV